VTSFIGGVLPIVMQAVHVRERSRKEFGNWQIVQGRKMD
jgi:hypothetical protein